MKKFLLGYTAGVVTAPAVYFVFRKPLINTVGIYIFGLLADEKVDASIYSLMTTRSDVQDLRKKHGRQIRQFKAQGHSVAEISKMIGHSEKAVRVLLFLDRHEGET